MTELFLKLSGPLPPEAPREGLADIAGLVVDGECLTPAACLALDVPVAAVIGVEILPQWEDEPGPARVLDGGLDACARERDRRPDRVWIPRLEVYRPDVLYRMADYPGEGFRFFAPDTSAIQGYRVDDDRPLGEALERARSLGFAKVWLHGRDAERRGDGLDLALLERARRWYADGLWLSGGATQVRHLVNLAREGGVSALVVGSGLLEQSAGQGLAAAVAPPPPPAPAEAPIHFRPRGGEAGVCQDPT